LITDDTDDTDEISFRAFAPSLRSGVPLISVFFWSVVAVIFLKVTAGKDRMQRLRFLSLWTWKKT
jgi:uncharacterized integral membrane protein